jgi:ferritin-like metal-binding protein YciE
MGLKPHCMIPQATVAKPTKAPKAAVSPKTEALKFLLENELRGLYWLDTTWVSLTPYVNQHTTLPQLQQVLQTNLHEAEEQLNLIAIIYTKLGKSITGKKNTALQGLIRQTESLLKQSATETISDVLILLAHQKIIGYKLTSCSTLYLIAKGFGI